MILIESDSKAFINQNHLLAFPKPFETKELMEKIENIISAGLPQ